MPALSLEKLITFNAAAERLSVTPTELCRLVVRGSLPRPIRLLGRMKFFESDVSDFLASLRRRRSTR